MKGTIHYDGFSRIDKRNEVQRTHGRHQKNMVKVFKKNFGCPPWNDEYEEGCREFTGCESCWFGYLNSEAE
jgi:hypothetical protein